MRTKHLLSFGVMLFAAFAALAQMSAPTNQLLIPAAGSVAGATGTFFRSDVTLVNNRNVLQHVQLRWLPQTAPLEGNAGPPSDYTVALTMPAHATATSDDFVAAYLLQSGLGAILITGVTTTGAIDNGAQLSASARIWTFQPGSAGTMSQTFPVLATAAVNSLSSTRILGLHNNSKFRSNVGVVNFDPVKPLPIEIIPTSDDPGVPSTPIRVVVGPMTMIQLPIPATPRADALQVSVSPQFGYEGRNWVAYGSSVDNVTGDSWSQLAMPLLTGQ